MSRWLPRLAILGLSFALLGVLSGPSAVPLSALPLAPQLPYDKATEGLSLLYPATWDIAEEPTENGYWVAWYDPKAQLVPPERIHLNDGAKIELQVFHFLPNVDVEAHLQKEAELADNVLSSGTLTAGGVEASFIETTSTADGGSRAKTVSFVYDGRWYHLTLAIFNYSGLLTDEANTYLEEFDRLVASIELREPVIAKAPGSAAPKFLFLPAAEQLTVQQGWFYHPDVGGGLHEAIDYVDGPVNTPASAFAVTASAGGAATYTTGWNGGWGNYVRVRHTVDGQTYYTIYAHLASSTLPVGVETGVAAGKPIGIAGTSGETGGYRHLHFELYHDVNGTNRSDPYDIYDDRDAYPTPCGTGYYWTTCPPSPQPSKPELWGIKKAGGGINKTQAHIQKYDSSTDDWNFVHQKATELHDTDSNWEFEVAEWSGGGKPEIWAIKKDGPGINKTQVHILKYNSSTDEWNFVHQKSTALHTTDSNWEFEVAEWSGGGKPELWGIKKDGAGINKTQVHIQKYNTSTGEWQFVHQKSTALHTTDSNWEFAVAEWSGGGKPELWGIKKAGGGISKTQVHIQKYKTSTGEWKFAHQKSTALHTTDSNWEFEVADWNGSGKLDLWGIKKAGGGINKTQVHIQKYNTSTKVWQFVHQKATELHDTDSNWEFAVANWN